MPRTASNSRTSITPSSSHKPVPMSNTYPSVTTAPTFGQTMKEGFALGTGSAIAHRVVSYVLGAPSVNLAAPTDKKVELSCEKERVAFENCLKYKTSDEFCSNEQLGYTQCIRLHHTN